ncbi:lysosomal protective protein-like [Rhinophrynus dorsalis]
MPACVSQNELDLSIRLDLLMDFVLLCALLLGTFSVEAAPTNDEIPFMPGLVKQPTFKHYSGYLNTSNGKYLHYWFVESQNDPSSSPVVLWLNGGPGCSSLAGFLTEHGPFLVQPDSKTLRWNPYSWNMIANVLYLESPAGVGYSYSEDKNYETGDKETTENNFLAVKEFFRLFPEFSENDFYITGESYGGIYVPTLAVEVSKDPSIKLKGIAVGNGMTSYDLDFKSQFYFFYYHGLMDSKKWADLQSYCCNKGECTFNETARFLCRMIARVTVMSVMHTGLNIYNLYQSCAGGNPGEIRDEGDHIKVYHPGLFSPALDAQFKKKLIDLTQSSKPAKMGIPCVNDTDIYTFLNRPEVRSVLHIPDHLDPWEICNDAVFANYNREVTTVENQYRDLLKKYRILVYVGDVDMACNFLGAQWFVDSLNLKVKKDYRSWIYNDAGQQQIVGYVKDFPNLTFLTIKGAGHMVPTDKPDVAFSMFSKFIRNEPF